ncbi:hypothetical protein HRR83_005679 [Exophiala dermatitidis]|uniref:MFS transporter, SP family, general alpha glucoside:H+ symporter n=2 Tax=Exophiala dermatitidis TaxID=5970 RepID=H6BVK7_EXODN|nr:MFS transporter, SP family, general alpha glucoside:H+ symporter [Exophiala dermatitidis NIH/UT8656]KAJ4508051.1 hypothetical protein HRR73_007489 [Exophiala dermatitidis]EHY55066.1 MFS transporter, SP family, general alpha glucoside:H+ symporter [Exophiala dermatitidis NIH/UT8656]KAJ4510844.1 hypothetical protein HRR75_005538 [Exophiala dermatitidis]KAJ4513235.1 hypothetical protein HRR74_006047 [Exophiala dermatitidis]KAJ4532017.1 hypothetical protein HRR77_008978 [Exophiala dermatitidis]
MGISKERITPIRDNWKCLLICLAVSLANCQYGFDTASVGGFQSMVGFLQIFGYRDPESSIGWSIGTQTQQLMTSFINVGTILGVFVTAPFAQYFGRRPGIWVASLVNFVAAGIQVGTTSLAGLYAGRILIGLANGYFITFANVYVAEVAPAHLRGFLVSFFGIWVNIGSVLGAVADNYSKTHLSKLCYQIPLASLFAVPFFLTVFMFFVPESPRWLLVHNRPEQAKRALERIRGNSLAPEFLHEEFIEMQRGIEEEKELASSASVFDIFKGTDLRRTIICFGTILSHAGAGLWLIIGYGTFFFQIAGIDKPFQASIISTCGSFAGVLVGLYFTTKVIGRRPSMLFGSAAASICMLAIGIAYSVGGSSTPAGTAIVAFMVLYGFFYNGFSGTLSWPVATEVVSSRLRVLTIGVCTGVNYFFNWLTSYTAPYFINPAQLNWGANYAYIWAGSNACVFLFFYFMLPEMKDRSLEELDELFQNRVPVKDFKKYQCVSSERAREVALKEAGDEKTDVVVETIEDTADSKA